MPPPWEETHPPQNILCPLFPELWAERHCVMASDGLLVDLHFQVKREATNP